MTTHSTATLFNFATRLLKRHRAGVASVVALLFLSFVIVGSAVSAGYFATNYGRNEKSVAASRGKRKPSVALRKADTSIPFLNVDDSPVNLTTDKSDYQPGEFVKVSGSGWFPGEVVNLVFHERIDQPFHDDETLIAIADGDGNIFNDQYQMEQHDLGVAYVVRATGTQSGYFAQAYFSDASAATLDQCANGSLTSPDATPCQGGDASGEGWVSGNLGGSKSHYSEGESISYRMLFSGLALSSHTVTIEWDTTKAGKHAIDYLTTYNRTVNSNPCEGVPGCTGVFSSFAIPADPQVTGAGVTPVAGVFQLFNGTITNVSAYSYADGTGFAGDKSARITITFTASNDHPVLAWGGHIATRLDWGSTNSAVSISGSPYHTRLIDLDGGGGNQDRSIQADAVVFPASITIIKDAVPDNPRDFNFSATGGLTPSSFTLDDDADPTNSNTQLFSNILVTDQNGNDYTITETPVSGWTLSFGNPICTVSSPNGGSQSAATNGVNINLREGEDLTCKFTNTLQQGKIKVVKQTLPDGSSQSFQFTANYDLNGFSLTDNGSNTSADLVPNAEGGGPYSVSETPVSGWTSDGGVCDHGTPDNITVIGGQTTTCTFTNTKTPKLTVIKHVINDNGGKAVAGDFTMNVTATNPSSSSFAGAESPGTTITLDAGTYSVSESGPSGYSQSSSAGCSGTIAPGDEKTCTITNNDQAGTLIVKKVVINDNGGTKIATDFSFQVNGGSTTAFLQDGGDTLKGKNTLTVDAGTYSVTEPAVTGYTTTYDNCTDVAVGNGETKTCTVTNNDQSGTLIVKKIVINDNGGTKIATDFSFQVNGGSAAAFLQDGGDTLKGKNTLTVDAGTYSVTEPAVTGYTTTYDNCSNVAVGNGETKTCTVTNNDQAGTLIVKKVVINDNGGTKIATDFSFQVNGGSATAFLQDGGDTLKGKNTLTVDAGTYSVTEPAVTGYTTTYDNCSNVAVGNGETKTCTVTNNDQPGTLIVKKIVINDNGGTKIATDFSFQVNGGSATAFLQDGGDTLKGKNTLTVDAGTYSVTEPAVSGYTTTYDNCSNVAVGNGETKTCTVTNNDQAGTLIVKKIVINDNGGTKIATDFSFQVNGGSATAFLQDGGDTLKGKNTLTVDAGTYSVTEPAVTGYTTTYYNCSNVAVGNGETKTCTVTNNDQAGTLIVKKIVINDNGGTKIATDFSFQVNGGSATGFLQDGADTLKGKNTLTVDAGSYSVTEPAVTGYTTTYDNCSNVSVGNGEEKTCTITNNDQAGTLIVKKIVINDNGGTKIATDFSFQVNGGSATAFLQDGGDTLKGKNTLTVDAGTYSVTEPAVTGYTTTYYNCSNVSVGNGETKTCTVTNNDQAGTLIVKKIVINDNGGTKIATDFSFQVNGGSATAFLQDGADTLKGKNTLTVNAGTYSVTEPAVTGYTTTYYNCSNVSVGNGETKTCTITNNDQPGTLIVKKIVINDNGGTKIATDFSFKVNGGSATAFLQDGADTLKGKNTLTVNVGSYSVTEPAVYGYTTTYDNCSNVSVGNGETKTCTVTNNDQPGTIIIEKLIKPVGSLTSFSFQTTGTGYNGFSLSGGQSNTQTLNAGSYTAKELVPLGWVLTGIGGSTDPNTPYNCVVTGSGGSTGVGDLTTQAVSITLKIGDTVKCTFENTGQGVTRTQGFWATHPQLANIAWFGGTAFGHTFPGVATVSGIGNTTFCNPVTKDVNSLSRLMGGFWSDISKTSTGGKRSTTDQARMQLLQQLLAAELNASAFGSVPSSGSFSTWESAYCSGNANDIKNAQQQAASFNTNGDSGQFTPGTSADSKTARAIADLAFWNILP